MASLRKLTTASDRAKALSGNGVALLLTFQRDVEMAKVVDAFMNALGEGDKTTKYAEAKKTLLDSLTKPVEKEGKYSKGSTIEFVWQGASKLTVLVNGKLSKTLDNTKLRATLMEVYTGSVEKKGGVTSVAPELMAGFQTQF